MSTSADAASGSVAAQPTFPFDTELDPAPAAYAGALVLDHDRGFLEYESLLERDWMLLMDFDREVKWMCEQPLRLRYSREGDRHGLGADHAGPAKQTGH